jgi:predicted RecA/RadA family phage recombinase
MKNYVQKGQNLTLTAPRPLNSGDGFLVGAIFAVASASASQGAPVVGVTEEVFSLPKAAGAITQGQRVYWDNTAFNLTTTATNNTLVGAAVQNAASGDATVAVKLTGQIAA